MSQFVSRAIAWANSWCFPYFLVLFLRCAFAVSGSLACLDQLYPLSYPRISLHALPYVTILVGSSWAYAVPGSRNPPEISAEITAYYGCWTYTAWPSVQQARSSRIRAWDRVPWHLNAQRRWIGWKGTVITQTSRKPRRPGQESISCFALCNEGCKSCWGYQGRLSIHAPKIASQPAAKGD